MGAIISLELKNIEWTYCRLFLLLCNGNNWKIQFGKGPMVEPFYKFLRFMFVTIT
jgi:hypothetical protein